MKSVMNRLIRLIGIALLLLAFGAVRAQRPYPVITPDNATQVVQIARYGNGVPRMMIFSPDGSRLAVATTLGVWVLTPHPLIPSPTQAERGETEMRLLEGRGGAASVTFNPDGSQIAAGGDDGSVMVWDSASADVVTRLENHIYPVSAVAWAENYLASGDWSGVVRVWDTTTWSEYRVLTMTEKIERLDFGGYSTEFLTANFGIPGCKEWNITSGEEVGCVLIAIISAGIYDATNGEWDARYLPDGAHIQIEQDNNVVATLDGFYGELGGVFFTEDGRVGASPLKSSYLWSLETGQPDDRPVPVASPDGSRIATFGNDGVIRLSDAATGELIAELHGHMRAVTGVAFSPDSRLLASSSNDGTIQVWDATVTEDSGSLVTLTGHNGGVTSVAFNADGTLLASSGYDGTVRLWGIKE